MLYKQSPNLLDFKICKINPPPASKLEDSYEEKSPKLARYEIYFYLIINVKKNPECCHPGFQPREKKSTYCKIPPCTSFDKCVMGDADGAEQPRCLVGLARRFVGDIRIRSVYSAATSTLAWTVQ